MTDTQATNERIYVCKRCPFGCVVKVLCDSDNNILSLTGNTCERGEEYARLRAEGLDDAAISKRIGEELVSTTESGSAPSASNSDTSAEGSTPKRPARYSAYRKRRKA